MLRELSQYHFPGVTSEKLQEDPYLPFTKMYLSMASDLVFYQGYLQPTPLERAKIYRGLTLACEGEVSIRNFLIFTSSSGLIIKSKNLPQMDQLRARFDRFMEDPDDRIFIPEGYDHLTDCQYPYYYKLLQFFRKTVVNQTRVICMQEFESKLLFLSSEGPSNRVQKAWRKFLDGATTQRITFSSFQVKSALEIFPWGSFDRFRVLPSGSGQVQLSVLECSPEQAQKKSTLINESSGDLSLHTLDLGMKIQDQYEMFGLLIILSKIWPRSISEMIPLLGTSKLIVPYSPDITEERIRKALDEFVEPELPENEVEVYTQDNFSEMSRLRKANLIKAPSGHWYSLFDLCQAGKKDPLTRAEFPLEFRQGLENTLELIRGPTLQGFPPPIQPNPEFVVITTDEGNTSFYVRLTTQASLGVSETFLFWKVPPIDPEFISEATKQIALKWTDGSFFGPFKETCLKYKLDPTLILSPSIYSLFHEVLENPGITLTEEKVRSQLALLQA